MASVLELIRSIAQVGQRNPSRPPLSEIEIFKHFFTSDELDRANLDQRDGGCTRREVLMRFLVLSAVLDQGPDLEGIRRLLAQVTNSLYQREVRFLHTPLEFFREVGVAIDEICEKHATIKSIRSAIWAQENRASPERYNLFLDNSRQVLNYAIFRWGVPLALPLLLERDCKDEDKKPTVLIDYLESWPSAEEMSQQLKDHERYGLGKAIGDKACHLLAKWMVSSFRLTRRKEISWGEFSFEVPYDSNAGRVLWRTGYLLNWASEKEYIEAGVIQPGRGKHGQNYIRVTNIRGVPASRNLHDELLSHYNDVALNHLKTHKRAPQKVEIQRIQHAYLLADFSQTKVGVAELDDGLIYIGTKFCFNHDQPRCEQCPIKNLCEGHNSNPRLIQDYRT